MFDLYKIKHIGNPPTRRYVGSFSTIDDIMKKFLFTPEEIIEAITGVAEGGYQIKVSNPILGDGKTQKQISKIIGESKPNTQRLFQSGIKKLHSRGKLKHFLSLVNIMRSGHEIEYTEKIKITI